MSSDERDLTDEESIEENDEDYLSDTPLDVNPTYPNLDDNMDSVIIITNLPEVCRLNCKHVEYLYTNFVTF